MRIADRLQILIDEKEMTRYQLAQSLKTYDSTVSNWFAGRNTPSKEKLKKIAYIFDVSVDWLTGKTDERGHYTGPTPGKGPAYTQEALDIAARYESLDAHGQELIQAVLDVESKRLTSAKMAEDSQAAAPPRPRLKKIPLMRDFAAGTGVTAGLPWEDYEVPEDCQAEFAVKVNGKSMEPLFADGEIALCISQMPDDGEIAAVMVDGENYIKQFLLDSYRNIYLFSVNRRYKDMRLMASGERQVKIWGTVLTDGKHIPAVPMEIND